MYFRLFVLLAAALLGAGCGAKAPLPGSNGGGDASGDGNTPSDDGGANGRLPGEEPWSMSYRPGSTDAMGRYLGGTETVNLKAVGNVLYAGIGYWHDSSAYSAQILRLAGPQARWELEYQPAGTGWQRITSLAAYTVAPGLEVLCATSTNVDATSPFSGENAVFLRDPRTATWTKTVPFRGRSSIRSTAFIGDASVGTGRLFAGTEDGIFGGTIDPLTLSVQWDASPEVAFPMGKRVMAMTECAGVLYAASKPDVYARDARTRTWTSVYSYSDALPSTSSGMRGLTCIDGLLNGVIEDNPGRLVALRAAGAVPGERLAEAPGLALGPFLTPRIPSLATRASVIGAYNDMRILRSRNGEVTYGFGLLAYNGSPANAYLVTRTTVSSAEPVYRLAAVPRLGNTDQKLEGTRAVERSPFSEDRGEVLYVGGFDAGQTDPAHETAWIYRVGLDTVLRAAQ
jgi:hypothetical protein